MDEQKREKFRRLIVDALREAKESRDRRREEMKKRYFAKPSLFSENYHDKATKFRSNILDNKITELYGQNNGKT